MGMKAKSHPIAQALVAGLLQGLGERGQDGAMIAAGERLALGSMVAAASAIECTGTRDMKCESRCPTSE
jgi:hypothetical protein